MVSLSERVQSFTNLVNGATWYIKRNLTGRVMSLFLISQCDFSDGDDTDQSCGDLW